MDEFTADAFVENDFDNTYATTTPETHTAQYAPPPPLPTRPDSSSHASSTAIATDSEESSSDEREGSSRGFLSSSPEDTKKGEKERRRSKLSKVLAKKKDDKNGGSSSNDAKDVTLVGGPAEGVVSPGGTEGGGGWGGFATGLQDKLFAKMLGQVLPSDVVAGGGSGGDDDGHHRSDHSGDKRKDKSRPPFSVTTMSSNFRRFNQRVGVVFIVQHKLIRLFKWKQPTHTLSFLAVYSFVCLDPYLMAALPVIGILFFLMVPAFVARHPPPPNSLPTDPYPARGPPSASAPEVKAVSELSKEFFRNLRDLQNSMDDFSVAHDNVVNTVGPATNFSSEELSSGLFLLLFFTSMFLFLGARYVPWKPVFLIGGWLMVCMSHPAMQRHIVKAHDKHLKPREKQAKNQFDRWVDRDIVLDEAPEAREVEIFELQRKDGSGEWESWIFSPAPYEKLSAGRIAGERPQGTRFFEDVKCPPGWEWKDKKWTLDLGSKQWVEERCIEGVEVEIEGERWVYDIIRGDEGWRGSTGEWRRRRWQRMVQRIAMHRKGKARRVEEHDK